MALTGDQAQQLHGAVTAAFDVDSLKQLTRFALGVTLENVVDAGRGLNAVTFDLIVLTEQRGITDSFILAIYKARPQNPEVLAFCRQHAPFVFDPQRSTGALAEGVTAGLAVVAETAKRPEEGRRVREIIDEFADDLAATRSLIELVKNYKALHDQLHHLDFRLYGVIARAAKAFRQSPEDRVELYDYVGDLRNLAQATGETAKGVPTDETGWVGNLVKAVDLLDAALADKAGEVEPERRALRLIKGVLGQQPSRINSLLMSKATELQGPLQELTHALREVQGALAGGGGGAAQIGAGLADLERLRPRLLGLIVEHDFWQRIDNQLRLAAENVDKSLDDLRDLWPDIAAAARELCDLRAESPWAGKLRAVMERFDAATKAGKAMEQRLAFVDFRRETRERFFKVDTELHELCGSLVSIVEPLRAVLESIGR